MEAVECEAGRSGGRHPAPGRAMVPFAQRGKRERHGRLVRKDAGSERLVAYSGRGGTGLGRVTQKRAGEAEPGPQHIDHNRRQGATRACRDSPEWAEVTPPRSSQLLL